MRVTQLKAFHQVALDGGFSQAAKTLNLTQPAISDQVSKLEEEYDVLLFDRRKKRVALTQFGTQLLDYTRRLFEVEQQTREFLSESQALRRGILRIIADSPHHVLTILAQFRAKYPGILISVRSGNSDEVVSALVSYDADIGVLGEVSPSKAFVSVPLGSTPIVAFASVNYPHLKSTKMSLVELAKHPLVMRETGSKTRKILHSFAKSAKIKLVSSIDAEGREAVREIVAAGAGIGFVSAAEFGHDRRLIKIDISDMAEHMDETLVCLKARKESKLIRTFMGLAEPQTT